MPRPDSVSSNKERNDIDLRNPLIAGLLAWLLPGWGHYYQKRYHKAILFFLCIMPTLIAGCVLASSAEVGYARNVYWSWRWKSGDLRLWWLAQAPIGVVAIPSLTQAWQINSGQAPMLGRFMAPPRLERGDRSGVSPVLSEIRQQIPHYELATYLTALAGLMNLLAIFDAVDGPFYGRRKEEKCEG